MAQHQLKTAAQQALTALANARDFIYLPDPGWTETDQLEEVRQAITALRAALDPPERTLTDEVIATLWHQNGGFHHHFARAVERWLKGNP